MHARPFLPLMFIASEPHTPSRHERRNDSVSSMRLQLHQRVEQHAVVRVELDVVVLHVAAWRPCPGRSGRCVSFMRSVYQYVATLGGTDSTVSGFRLTGL